MLEGRNVGVRQTLNALRRRSSIYLPALVASTVLGAIAVHGIWDRVGHPAAPLDDSFIHFQYARRLAEGGFFSFVEGKGYTSGATSTLWPLLLAPFYLVGFRGLGIVVAAWVLGTLFHAALATEAYRLARPIAGRAAAVGAGAMCVSFGAFAWFAWSGMETIALGWALLRAGRLAAERLEEPRPDPSLTRSLMTMAFVGPLLRPEGALCSLLAAVALGLEARRARGLRERAGHAGRGLLALAGASVVPALHWAFTGSPGSTTTAVKWLLPNPYYRGPTLWSAIGAHVDLLLDDILQGGTWGAIFVPDGLVYALAAGAVATIVAGVRQGRAFRAAIVIAIALGTFAPTTYLSFLWNRVRYVWPFAGAWFVLLACLAAEIGCLVRWRDRRATFVTPLLAGVFAGALATKLPWTLADLAQSAHAIDRQQVALGHWARDNLPADARVGVNDTGAIAYFGERETFDVVGLTTMGEAKYWVAGAGSRFEHYETMDRAALPTHFIVYPQWMGMPAVLGPELTRATVEDQSILGGVTKVAYEARWDRLGSGALPGEPLARGRLVDEIDVADLESEQAHAYQLFAATEADNQAVLYTGPAGQLADGGRFRRTADRFVASLDPGVETHLVLRVVADEPLTLVVRVDDEPVGDVEIPWSLWTEAALVLPADRVGPTPHIEVAATRPGTTFASLHYWLFQP